MYISGNLLFSEDTVLKTTNQTFVISIAGLDVSSGYQNSFGAQARFSSIASFIQLSPTHVVISDTGAFCLRLLTRTNRKVSDYAGTCRLEGYADGDFQNAKFKSPKYMVRGEGQSKHIIYVVDQTVNAIRTVNTRIRMVATLIQSDSLVEMTGIVVDSESTNTLIVISSKYIKKVATVDTDAASLPAVFESTKLGIGDGDFSEATMHSPERIVALGKGVYLTSGEKLSTRLRVIDLVTETISSICSGHNIFHTTGSISECLVPSPTGMALVRNLVYIGGFAYIYKLSGKPTSPR